jgi:hypothetical protein
MIDLNALIDSAPQRYNIVITLLKAHSVLSRHRKIATSVSGGSDSDIITDLIELVKPDYCETKYVFFDTGLEYEATKRHLGEVEQRYGVTIDRRKPRKTIPTACREYGIGTSDYFENDIVVRFVDFVRKVYGEGTLDENLAFIADALYPSGIGSAQERIRRYFLNDFYKDHVKIYQKRPIYWLLDSGKQDGFKALFYLHRYEKSTIAIARTDYLHQLQRKYEGEISRLDTLSSETENGKEKAAYSKEADNLQSKINECRTYDQIVAHIAHQQIELDLDDGVKVNYEKFQGVDVPLDNGKTVKMDLLGRI